ncbi:hypothetical protein [Neobacillus notoginsengisoli]|nr:hypothetical protein [Neobacillus notoginsengisoli]
MLAVIIITWLIVRFKSNKRMTKIFLSISLPIFIIIQLYFWNLEFNNFVKSYVFPSRDFVCEDYGVEVKEIAIPLPKRTVFLGKEEACSPIYSTYVSDTYFLDFYKTELDSMKNRGEVLSYSYVENKDEIGFEVEISPGNKVDILIQRSEDSTGLITIEYKRN